LTQLSSPGSIAPPAAIGATLGAKVSLDRVHKTFLEGEKERTVLHQVSLTFEPGEFIVLLGHSGSGKSTLLNLISGIDQPSSGEIYINDRPITQLNERARTLFRRDTLGFIFQFFNLIPTLTVLENVTLPQELAGVKAHLAQAQGRQMLEAVGLADRCETYPDRLSGGQQQRVAIARALVHNPALILADEPTGNLDEETGDRVFQLLLSLTRTAHKTLIMATHNPDLATEADRIFRVQDGHLIQQPALQQPTVQQPT
ncbi:MAG: ABC transporter ATP-binding protein, partial [Prochlorothrix sp.]|nr:ABC transporter ATP-binding protein [Prochlorothrix sp.]